MPYRTERVSGRCRQASHPAPPSKQPPGQGALYVSEDNVTSCAMQAFIAGYCEISLIKSVSERRNYFERSRPGCPADLPALPCGKWPDQDCPYADGAANPHAGDAGIPQDGQHPTLPPRL